MSRKQRRSDKVVKAVGERKPNLLIVLLASLSDADGDKPQQAPLGRETTVQGALMIIDRHLGQHLGQRRFMR